jgi:hypothetical protein
MHHSSRSTYTGAVASTKHPHCLFTYIIELLTNQLLALAKYCRRTLSGQDACETTFLPQILAFRRFRSHSGLQMLCSGAGYHPMFAAPHTTATLYLLQAASSNLFAFDLRDLTLADVLNSDR